MNQRVSAQDAWILHRRAYRDNSLILDLLTKDYGVISVVARSARKSRGSSLLQAFQPLQVDFFRKSELGTLGAFESGGKALSLQGQKLWCGFYVNELCLRLMDKEQTQAHAWELYLQTMEQLLQQSAANTLRHFEYQLLELAGYALDDRCDSQGRAIDALAHYHWHPEFGLQRVESGVPGQVLLNLTARNWLADVTGCRRMLASMIEPLLGARPLKTASILRELTALRSAQQQQ